MPPRLGYCTDADLLLGDMTLSTAISPAKFIGDSADEIDVRIGRTYVVPVDPLVATALAMTTLKIVNARLASGRILMAQAQAAQDDSLHAYGMYLIGEAEATLEAIETNRLPLDDAPVREDVSDTPAPSITNQDAHSAVDAFYGEFWGNNSQSFLPSSPIWRPGG